MSIGATPSAGGTSTPPKTPSMRQLEMNQQGGPVNEVKMTSDQSGKSGDSDYFSALGYDA
jgi:hypothetical protein